MSRITVHLIAAARPNFMKVAPLYHALTATDWCDVKLVHTGQHYDVSMSDVFFRDLRLPEPDFHLEVGSGTHAEQIGGVMIAYERVCNEQRPGVIIVVGDVNSTAACAMVGAKLWIPVVHLEAGLRSRDRRMPEEINRLVTDAIADVLWTPSPDANENLIAEGVAEDRIDLIGNIMIDSFEMLRDNIELSTARQDLGLDGKYGLVTLHRPSNVDNEADLRPIISALSRISARIPLVFVAHPRTIKNLERFGMRAEVGDSPGFRIVDPMSYVDFMNLVTGATLTLTDSGGLQEETTYLGIPCLTLRENTERPVTVTMGTNKLVDTNSLETEVDAILNGNGKTGERPPLWDGHTAMRATECLKRRYVKS